MGTDLAVVIPSRGRPEQCATLVHRIGSTTARVGVCVVVDEDDPTRGEYARRLLGSTASMITIRPAGHAAAINAGAAHVLHRPGRPAAIAKLDDDHWPVTSDWDTAMLAALDDLGGEGIVYGDDLLQGKYLPTAPAISAGIIEALGWMCPPALRHMFVDDFWRDLGTAAGCLQFLPDVVIEHRHPAVSKAELDEGYIRVGTEELFVSDQAIYRAFVADPDGLPRAVAAVSHLLKEHL